MSRNRLCHMGLVEDNKCSHCGEIETQIHVVESCQRALQLWDLVRQREPPVTDSDSYYWNGLNGGNLELKMECLWHLLNSKDLNASEIYLRSTVFIDTIEKFKKDGQGDIEIGKLLT